MNVAFRRPPARRLPCARPAAFAPGAPDAARLAALPAEAAEFVRAAAAAASRFEGDAGTTAEFFVRGRCRHAPRRARRARAPPTRMLAYERAGGALVAKLLLSGEATLVIDFDRPPHHPANSAARLAFAALLRSWRYDLYRTKLKPSQKPSLTEIVIVGAGEGAEAAWASFKAIADGIFLTRELVTEPANIIYPHKLRRARARSADRRRRRDRGARRGRDDQARHGRAARRVAGLAGERRSCS